MRRETNEDVDLIGGKEEVTAEVEDFSDDSTLEALVEEHSDVEDGEDLPMILEELEDAESQEDYVDYETIYGDEFSEVHDYVDANDESDALRLFASYCSGGVLLEDEREKLERYQMNNLFEGYLTP